MCLHEKVFSLQVQENVVEILCWFVPLLNSTSLDGGMFPGSIATVGFCFEMNYNRHAEVNVLLIMAMK